MFGYKVNIPISKDFINDTSFTNRNGSVLQIIFAGTTSEGILHQAGYAAYNDLLNSCFLDHEIDIFDFHGASRSKNRDYTTFKAKFGGSFFPLPGSFELLNLF